MSSLDEATSALLDVINGTYHDFDNSRQMLERSLDLSSQELRQANAELRALLAERNAAEHQMQVLHAQRLEAAGLLAGGAAHDFNNLLAVIKGSCEVLVKLTEVADPRSELLKQIEVAAGRAAVLTRQLLAFGRRQVLEPRVIDLNRTIAALEQLCRPLVGEAIELRWSLAPELPAINADPSQIEQVLINLIVNARDAMPAGGTLELTTARASANETRALEAGSAPFVRLSVKDSGAGMAPEIKARIFEPFFTTKAPGKGTGLGLSTVYGIVRQSGGFITVDSEVELGTTFHVFLPESEPAANVG
ncbi:MAG TPA: ATP-binding protein [Polyangiaceae bacterium]|nr:ATP-binding protein [Polyangiaceae bacterium]